MTSNENVHVSSCPLSFVGFVITSSEEPVRTVNVRTTRRMLTRDLRCTSRLKCEEGAGDTSVSESGL